MILSFIFGTRPEAIKLAPVIHAARARGHVARVVVTGQHRELLEPILGFFGLRADVNLDVMAPNQGLPELSARILHGLAGCGEAATGDVVVVQGDTTSAFLGAYWGFLRGVPVAHVEAGLRTGDLDAPFPEEANRQLIARLASRHFAPTEAAAARLADEGLSRPSIHVVGNTAIDALLYAVERLADAALPAAHRLDPGITAFIGDAPLVLVTAHRRESHGAGISGICDGVLGLLARDGRCRVVFPVHPSPIVRDAVEARLGGHPRVRLCAPLGYAPFVELLRRADLILTDSGGVQEEAPTFGKPILVLRDATDRPEANAAGFATLVGTDARRIAEAGGRALAAPKPSGPNPFGDGEASRRIVELLEGLHETASLAFSRPPLPSEVRIERP